MQAPVKKTQKQTKKKNTPQKKPPANPNPQFLGPANSQTQFFPVTTLHLTT